MRFASLGSGSRGNALVVEAGRTKLLVDCGFGPRELAGRLARIGLLPGDVDGVLLTHEHGDHVGGIVRCAERYGFPVYASHGTCAAAGLDGRLEVVRIDSHTAFAIQDIEIQPYPVPHDAREPTQFILGDGQVRLGVLTDAGCVTPHMVAMLEGCEALVLECNHDREMLLGGNYPRALKQRIDGRLGHLDNEAAASLLQRIDCGYLQHVVAAHLSEQNNTPELARAALARPLGCSAAEIPVADQACGIDWLAIR